jgi:hypothetical protein
LLLNLMRTMFPVKSKVGMNKILRQVVSKITKTGRWSHHS